MINTIKQKTLNALSFALIIFLLCVPITLLAQCKQILECAIAFGTIIFICNEFTHIGGYSALPILYVSLGLVSGFYFLHPCEYRILGKLINGMVFASLFSLLISATCSNLMFKKCLQKMGQFRSGIISIMIGVISDAILMSIFFAFEGSFGYRIILKIFVKDLIFKSLFGLLLVKMRNTFSIK